MDCPAQPRKTQTLYSIRQPQLFLYQSSLSAGCLVYAGQLDTRRLGIIPLCDVLTSIITDTSCNSPWLLLLRLILAFMENFHYTLSTVSWEKMELLLIIQPISWKESDLTNTKSLPLRCQRNSLMTEHKKKLLCAATSSDFDLSPYGVEFVGVFHQCVGSVLVLPTALKHAWFPSILAWLFFFCVALWLTDVSSVGSNGI